MPALIRKSGDGVCDGASRDSSFSDDNMTTNWQKLSWVCILQFLRLQLQRSAPQVDYKSVVGPQLLGLPCCVSIFITNNSTRTFWQFQEKHAKYTHRRLWKRCSITAPTTATLTACKTAECLAMYFMCCMVSYPVGEKTGLASNNVHNPAWVCTETLQRREQFKFLQALKTFWTRTQSQCKITNAWNCMSSQVRGVPELQFPIVKVHLWHYPRHVVKS